MTGMAAVLAVAAALQQQTPEQLLEGWRKALELHGRGAHGDTVRLCAELARARPDREGTLRVRVGNGLEDLEFEPRRLAGDASLALARSAADPAARLGHVAESLKWYQAAVDLKLAKAGSLLEAARAERAKAEKDLEAAKGEEGVRRRLDDLRSGVVRLVADGAFESALGAVDKARPAFPDRGKVLDELKAETEASFRRWQEGVLGELRQDLAAFRAEAALADPARTAERFARYRTSPERAVPTRLDPMIGWAVRLSELFAKGPPDGVKAEALAEQGAALGPVAFKAAQGIVLERAAAEVRDPGPGATLAARWEASTKASAAFGALAARARSRAEKAASAAEGARKDDWMRWMREELPAYEARVAAALKALPDREASAAVAGCLERLSTPGIAAGAKRDGYAGVEAELGAILAGAKLEDGVRARGLAGQAVARAHALFLDGLPREAVVDRCRPLAREALAADATALAAWKGRVSPRVEWVLEQAGR